MAFPATPLSIKGEFYINGAWVDVTSDVRLDEAITINNRGTANEGSSLSASTCNFKLNNRHGKYSNRNPLSPYYGLLPRNLPVRFSVADNTVTYRAYPTGDTIAYVQTTDKASLDITGDLDVRADIELPSWTPYYARTIWSKYLGGTSNQRSWAFYIQTSGKLSLSWSSLGTSASLIQVNSTVPVPAQGRCAVRAVLDVNNGSGGYTVTFYTSDTLSGTWTQLGSAVSTTSGTTSIFNSTAKLVFGYGSDGSNPLTSGAPFHGKAYAAEVRNGIGGTVVAKLDFASRSVGDTSWSDGLASANTWTVVGVGSLQTGNRRFTGEIAQMPMEWDNSGNDIWIRVQASDVTRRLMQGTDPIRSSLYRYITSDVASLGELTGYWPMEDNFSATQGAAYIGNPAKVTDVSFGADETLPSSEGVATLNSGSSKIEGAAKVFAASTTQTFTYLFKCAARPASETVVMYIRSTGTVRRFEISMNTTATRVRGYDDSGAIIVDQINTDGQTPQSNWVISSLSLETSGGTVNWELRLGGVYTGVGGGFGGSINGSYTGTVGRFSSWLTGSGAALADFSFAHFFIARNVSDASLYTSDFFKASLAFVTERASDRLYRLAAEEGVPVEILGGGVVTEPMGPQRPDQLFNLFKECMDVDGGILYPAREFLGYRYRTRPSLYAKTGVTLSYSGDDLSGELKPVADDQLLVNDATVRRPFGSEARSVKDTGPLGVGTIGRYATTLTRNSSTDERLKVLADYVTFLGTWDEERYPTVQVNLERANFVNDAAKAALVAATDVAGVITIANLPSFLPPDDIDLLVRGVSKETLGNKVWEFLWNCSPYGPYKAMKLNDSSRRAAGSNSVLAAGITSSATSFTVTTATGAKWGTTALRPGNFPLDIKIGGEVITISGISGTGTTQTFTVSPGGRAKNGIVKAHLAGAAVQVAKPFYAVL